MSGTRTTEAAAAAAAAESKERLLAAEVEWCAEKLTAADEASEAAVQAAAEAADALEDVRESLAEVAAAADEAQDAVDAVEKRVFKQFCRDVGVASAHEFEERRESRASERQQKRARFESTVARLESQLAFERSHNVVRHVTATADAKKAAARDLKRAQAELKTAKKAADAASAAAAKQSALLRTAQDAWTAAVATATVRSRSTLFPVRAATHTSLVLSSIVVPRLRHRQEAKKEAGTRMHELGTLQKAIAGLEGRLSRLRAQKSELLRQSQLEEVALPFRAGMSEADLPRHFSPSQTPSSSTDSAASHVEGGVDVDALLDFSGLSQRLRRARAPRERRTVEAQLQADIEAATASYEALAPNIKASEGFADLKTRLRDVTTAFEEARDTAGEAKAAFTAIRDERNRRFMAAFEHVSGCIDPIYKELTKSAGGGAGAKGGDLVAAAGTAYLTLENTEEPYLHGIKYNCLPPMKRFRDIEHLSGGEKTMAALALLFAVQAFRPSPFFVLDEVDAALDSHNVARIAAYLKSRSADIQCLVISLKDALFANADAIVGVYSDREAQVSKSIQIAIADLAD